MPAPVGVSPECLNQGFSTQWALLTLGLDNSSWCGLSCALWGVEQHSGFYPLDANNT